MDEAAGVDGVALDADGRPNGELHEFVAMGLVQELAKNSDLLSVDAEALAKFGQNAVNTGTTTVTDLGSRVLMSDEGVDLYRTSVGEDYPARMHVFHFGAGVGPMSSGLVEDAQRLVENCRNSSTDTLRFGG